MRMEWKRWPALVRVGLFWVLYLGAIFVTGKLQSAAPSPYGSMLWGATSVPLVFLLNYLFARLEGRSLSDLWLTCRRRDNANFLLGLGIGLSLLPLTLALCAVVHGSIRVRLADSFGVSVVLLAVLPMALLVVMEEFGFRAYSLSTLVAAIGKWPGQVLTACAFAACHILFGWPIQSILLGVLPSGLLFGAAAYATRSVAPAIGLHLGMNFAQWAVRERGGILKLVIDPSTQQSVQMIATYINLALVAGWCCAFWFKRRQTEATVRTSVS